MTTMLSMRVLRPRLRGIWYINGQTERWPSTFGYTQNPSSNRVRIQWTGGGPDESPYGWEVPDIWVTGLNAALSDIDTSASPGTATEYVVFQPPAGVWDIDITLSTQDEEIGAEEAGLFLYQITSGDDKILSATSGRQANMPANFGGADGTIIRTQLHDVELDGSQRLYVLLFTQNTLADFRGYLSLKKRV